MHCATKPWTGGAGKAGITLFYALVALARWQKAGSLERPKRKKAEKLDQLHP